jgi:hypothetical protein
MRASGWQSEETMRNKILLVIGLVTALPWAGALAQTQASGDPRPFTAQEQAIISRNAALSDLVDRDPQLVRDVLGAIASASEMRAGYGLEPPKKPSSGQAPDAARNPDLQQLERVSPEAALDLFQRLKRASGNR